MKILITGGSGFIGATLTQELLKLGHNVTVIDKIENPHLLQMNPNIHFFKFDICDRENLLNVFNNSNFNGIVHLAAVSRVIDAENNKEECIRTNIGGINNLLSSIEKTNQNPWLIFGSSREVYGEQKELPVKESATKNHVNIYGKSKLEGEKLFDTYAKDKNLSLAILRFSNVYGNKYDIKTRVVPRFIKAIHSGEDVIIEGGDQIIDFTHIDDTIHSIIKTIDYLNIKKTNIIEDFHILPGIGWSLHRLIEIIENNLGKKANIKIKEKRNYDVEKFIGDNSKSKSLLNLRDFHSLEEGIKLAINEYIN